MKYLFVSFLVSLFSFSLYSQTENREIVFEEKVHNFGAVYENKGKVSHTFIFWNKGKIPLVIERVYASCGCTSYDYTKAPVKPGGKGSVTVTFNPLYRPGKFSKEIVIFTNHGKTNRVWVNGSVIPFVHPVEEDYPYSFGDGLHLNLKILAFGRVEKGKSKQILLRFANNTSKPMTLTFVVDCKDSNIKVVNPGKLNPKTRGEVTISYNMDKPIRGDVSFNIFPVVNGKRLQQSIQVKVTGIH